MATVFDKGNSVRIDDHLIPPRRGVSGDDGGGEFEPSDGPIYLGSSYFNGQYIGEYYLSFYDGEEPLVTAYTPGWDETFDEGTTADLYVDGSRPDDTGAGTSLAVAKKTIAAAMTAMVDGQTIMVKDHGSPYRETVNWTGHGGPSSASKSKLIGYGTDKPTISAAEIVTGFTPCVIGDAPVVGTNWASIYKKTGILKSTLPNSEPRNLNLYEAGDALHEAIDRVSDSGDPFYTRTPSNWHDAAAHGGQFYKAGDVAATGGIQVTGVKDTVVTSAYTTAQIEAADIMVYVSANASGRSAITDITGDIMHLAVNPGTYQTGVPYSNRWCLVNILPAMISGSYGFIDGGGATFDLYVWPRNAANLTSGIEYSAREYVVNIASESNIEMRSLRLIRAATSGGTTGSGIRMSSGATAKSFITVRNVYSADHMCSYVDGRGYGVFDFGGVSDLTVHNCTLDHSRAMFGVYIHGGTTTLAIDTAWAYRVDFRYNDILGSEQSGVRVYVTRDSIFAYNRCLNCGRAVHANKMNFYEQCFDILVWGNDFTGSSGYFTWQEADNLFVAFNYMPASNDDIPRSLIDQNRDGVGDPVPGTYIGTQTDSLLFNNTCPPYSGNLTYAFNWAVGKTGDTTALFKYYNNIINDDNETEIAQVTERDYNLYTLGTAVGANSVTSTAAAVYTDPISDNHTFKVGGPALTMVGKNMQTLITNILIPRFGARFTDWSKDMLGNDVDWTDAPVGHLNNRP